jgi:hypothetical protein
MVNLEEMEAASYWSSPELFPAMSIVMVVTDASLTIEAATEAVVLVDQLGSLDNK